MRNLIWLWVPPCVSFTSNCREWVNYRIIMSLNGLVKKIPEKPHNHCQRVSSLVFSLVGHGCRSDGGSKKKKKVPLLPSSCIAGSFDDKEDRILLLVLLPLLSFKVLFHWQGRLFHSDDDRHTSFSFLPSIPSIHSGQSNRIPSIIAHAHTHTHFLSLWIHHVHFVSWFSVW